jgi:predicted transcriptional regulator
MITHNLNLPYIGEGNEKIEEILAKLEETCKNCHPLTPLACTLECSIWKLKNENRKLLAKKQDPYFLKNLLNTLKNKRRLQILEVISEKRHTIDGLQQELRKIGHHHSRQTIAAEYIQPLLEAGLAEENQHKYQTTLFGSKLKRLIEDLHNIGEALPPHSECYEETLLSMLLTGPKTYESLRGTIPGKSVPRVLNRLLKIGFVGTNPDNHYIYFFRSKRDPTKDGFSTTEKRVYENIPTDGISAPKLAEKTMISLRRTYKYVRRLKGKKLVFCKRKPKSYSLTPEGALFASRLEKVGKLVEEALATATLVFRENASNGNVTPNIRQTNTKEKVESVLLSALQRNKTS